MLENVREEHPQAVKSAIDQIVPVWLDAFTQLLSLDAAKEVQADWEAITIRVEIFKVSLQKVVAPGCSAEHLRHSGAFPLHSLEPSNLTSRPSFGCQSPTLLPFCRSSLHITCRLPLMRRNRYQKRHWMI
jgi:hypothetical protein